MRTEAAVWIPAVALLACGETGTRTTDGVASLTTGEVTLEIGVLQGDPDYEFSALLEARTLSDGRVFVADAGTRELRVYDRDGRHVWTAGGNGDAPGEFTFMVWARPQGSRIVAWDISAKRLSWFAQADGSFLESARLPALDPNTLPWVTGWASNGSYLALTDELNAPPTPQPLIPNTSRFVWADPEGRFDVELEFEGAPRVDVDGILQQAPLTVRPVAEVMGDTLWVLLPGEGGYRMIEPGGEETRVVGDSTPRALTDEIRRAYRAAQMAATNTGQPLDYVERRLDRIAALDVVPTYGDMVVGLERRVWLERFDPAPGELSTWEIFDPSGALQARATLPARFTLTEAGSGYVLGIWRDDLDVSYVRRYALVQPDGGDR